MKKSSILVSAIFACVVLGGCAVSAEPDPEPTGRAESAYATPIPTVQGSTLGCGYVPCIYYTWSWADRLRYLASIEAQLTEAAYRQLVGEDIYQKTKNMNDAQRRDYLLYLANLQMLGVPTT